MRQATWVPAGIDPAVPSPARVYDVHLGGSHNFAADQELARRATAIMPELPALLRANRAFLRRAVEFLVGAGIRQFLDLGSGIPTAGNVHEIAQGADPSCRVVYVDNDPVAAAHSWLMLRDNPLAAAVEADLRRPDHVLRDPAVRALLDLSEPVAVLSVAVLHFLPDTDDPARVIARYLDALRPGSYLALSHATAGERHPDQVRMAAELYRRSMPGFTLRDRSAVTALFDGLDLVDPGVVYLSSWRPAPGQTPTAPDSLPAFAGVAVKP